MPPSLFVFLSLSSSIADSFLANLSGKVNALKCGLPWDAGVVITPLAEPTKVRDMQGLIDDAKSKGATVVNESEGGGSVEGNMMRPAVVFPVTSEMRLWHEEQFGPVVPVAVFDSDEEVNESSLIGL